MQQASLFGPAIAPPPGFRYRPSLITPAEERIFLAHVRELPFRPFEFHGYTGKRRVVSFGWTYDFGHRALRKLDVLPDFLIALRRHAAEFARLEPDAFQQTLVTEYSPGAGIGWHKDKVIFGEVIGVSLVSSCVFRLRRQLDIGWERINVVAEPRSAYLLSGTARTDWEHSIPPVSVLRYSVTFRSLRGSAETP